MLKKMEKMPLEQTRRERKKVELRRSLLAVSRRLFENKGYENTLVDDIADTADISRATVFNYFPSKESILQAIFEEEMQDLRYYLTHDLKNVSSGVEKIYRFFLFWVVDTIGFRSTVGKVLMAGMGADSAVYNHALTICKELVEEAQQKGEINRQCVALDVALLLTGIYYSVIINTSVVEYEAGQLACKLLDEIFTGIIGPAFVRPMMEGIA